MRQRFAQTALPPLVFGVRYATFFPHCGDLFPSQKGGAAGFFDMLSPDKTGGFFYFLKKIFKKSKKVFDFS